MRGMRTGVGLAALAAVAMFASACGGSDSAGSGGSSSQCLGHHVAVCECSRRGNRIARRQGRIHQADRQVHAGHPQSCGDRGWGSHRAGRPSWRRTLLMRSRRSVGLPTPPATASSHLPLRRRLSKKLVLDKVDGIILIAITPDAVSASISAAKTANIPIVCALCGPDLPTGIINVTNDSAAAGRAQAAYAVSVTKPGSTIVVYQNTEFKASQQQTAETAKHAKELCPTCTIDTPSLLLAEASQPNAPIFTSLLTKYPEGKLGAVILPFDTPAGALSNTASGLGRSDFTVVGFGGLAPFIDMVGTGKPVVAKADVLISTPYYGWVSVDQLGRAMAKQTNWDSKGLPVSLVDKTTYSRYTAGSIFLEPTYDYKTELPKLWGK